MSCLQIIVASCNNGKACDFRGVYTPKNAYEILGFFGELLHRFLGFLKIFKDFKVFVRDFQRF